MCRSWPTAGSRSRSSSRFPPRERSGSSTGTRFSPGYSRSWRSGLTARSSSRGRRTARCAPGGSGAAARLFTAAVLVYLAASVLTAVVAHEIFRGLTARPLAVLATALFFAGLVTRFGARRAGRDLLAFLGSAAFLLGVLAATAASAYPTMIKSASDASLSLTAQNSAAGERSLRLGLLCWPVGLVLAIVYYAVLFHIHRGKASAAAEGEGY